MLQIMAQCYWLKFLNNNITPQNIKNEVLSDLKFNIYPNPTGNVFTLLYSGTQTNREIKINVIDALGKTVYTETTNAFAGILKKEINLSGISKGTYFIKLSNHDFIETKKIVVE